MSFQKRFKHWQEKMQDRSEEDRHKYALSAALFLGALIFFVVVSGWYFRLSGGSIGSSILSEFEQLYSEQKSTINNFFENE